MARLGVVVDVAAGMGAGAGVGVSAGVAASAVVVVVGCAGVDAGDMLASATGVGAESG
ncbi:MAG: hypothetical protein HY671_12990 [Chloroflexi bacterium]|nr:hypothetical protein [Chloroflexota bacterium]